MAWHQDQPRRSASAPALPADPGPRPGIPLIDRAFDWGDRPALFAAEGSWTYRDLLTRSAALAGELLQGKDDLHQQRVAFLTTPSLDYVMCQWAIWRAGGVAVPLCPSHPLPELQYVIEDSAASILLTQKQTAELLAPLAQERKLRLCVLEDVAAAAPPALPRIEPSRRALMLYTSGTTSRPKGVVTTHGNIAAQIRSLVEAWAWTEQDRIANFLPLHHIHGVINIVGCALWSGARCEMLPGFEAAAVWERLLKQELSLLMAVPTIYSRLIAAWEQASPQLQQQMTAACAAVRLMVSGSAALPASTLEKWRTISGQVLLERYGMTEIGMGLSNPLHGERQVGRVGKPLPGVQVRLLADNQQPASEGLPGEIQIRGETVFLEYWQRPQATHESFVDGWFKTGDIAVCDQGSYRILGRNSVDIIKTGGYKVSALEIEEVLREHPAIDQCVVVGLPDEQWGETVAAAVILRPGQELALSALRAWAKAHLANYKVPTRLLCVEALPRNAMGKVLKPQVVKMFAPAGSAQAGVS